MPFAPRNVLKRVDVANPRVASYSTATHYIYFSQHIQHTHPVVALLPNHRDRYDPRMQVLRSSAYRSRDEFNRTLARRFAESLEHTSEGQYTRLAVCYGDHVFVCDGITGTPYVLWAARIKTEHFGTVPNTLRTNVPCILNMDGSGRVKGLYLLPERVECDADLQRVPITRHSVEFFYDAGKVPFVNETRPQRPEKRRVPTQSRRQALAMLSDLTKRNARAAVFHMQQAQSEDEEFSRGVEITVDMEDVTVTLQDGPEADDGLGVADPLGLNSEYDDGADPFAE